MTEVLAAIDCGTNSTRLLINRGAGQGAERLSRLMTITRLGQDVATTGRLAPEAIDRTAEALRRYRAEMDQHGVDRMRVTATSAARDADNRDDLFATVESILGQPPELLSGQDEAAISFTGATAELDPVDGPFLVVDIGGGSTEFAVGKAAPEGALSVDMGCVRFTEAYLHSDPPLPEELSACLSVADVHLDDVARQIPAVHGARTFVGLAGTVSSLAAVELGLADYDRDAIHHFRLTREASEDVFRTLATEALADRIHNPGLEPERADVIVAGACIFVAVMRRFDFDECLVSESDILDGLVASLADTGSELA